MAKKTHRAESAFDNLTRKLSTRDAILLLLDGVETPEQFEAWREDMRQVGSLMPLTEFAEIAYLALQRHKQVHPAYWEAKR